MSIIYNYTNYFQVVPRSWLREVLRAGRHGLLYNMYIYIYIYMYMHIYIYICIYMYTYLSLSLSLSISLSISLSLCMYIYIYTYVHIIHMLCYIISYYIISYYIHILDLGSEKCIRILPSTANCIGIG